MVVFPLKMKIYTTKQNESLSYMSGGSKRKVVVVQTFSEEFSRWLYDGIKVKCTDSKMLYLVFYMLVVMTLFNSVTGQKFSDLISDVAKEKSALLSDIGKNNTSTQNQTTTHIVEQTTLSMGQMDASRNQSLPFRWEEFCSLSSKTETNLFYKCDIGPEASGRWKLKTFRKWIVDTNNITYSFDIKCHGGANVSLPWPIKSPNIVQLMVKDCLIVDFFNDYNNMNEVSRIPDQLEILSLSDIRIYVKIFEIFPIFMSVGDIPKDFDCGHEDTLKVFVYRNISYEFPQSDIDFFTKQQPDTESQTPGADKPDVLGAGRELLSGSRMIEHKCKFLKLEHVDQSISNSKSKFHLSLLTENSFFPELKSYNLSKTGIKVINRQFKEWWTYFPKLQTLDLSNNFIKTVDIDPTSYSWHADTFNLNINLRNNNISSLTVDDVKMIVLQSNIFVHLEGNPFNCECSPSIIDLMKMIQTDSQWMKPEYARYQYLRHLRCNRPDIASGTEFINLDYNSLPCLVKLVMPLPILIVLVVTVVILIIIIILLTRFRHEIRILTYTRFNIILPCQPAEKYESKIYDAFVSYNNSEEEWVTETFEKLEKSESGNIPSFRFCLHHRDFIPGKTIFDNVIDSVESSRHTVIILSKNFLKSNFCMYEFREAFQQSIIERKRHLVVVLMEEIPEKELPNDLKRCLKTFTYIKKDDIIFTDRLVYALSYKSSQRSLKQSSSIESSVDSDRNRTMSTCESVFSDSSNPSPSISSINSFTPIFPKRVIINGNAEKQELHV